MSAKSAVILVTAYLLVYTMLCGEGLLVNVVPYLFILSPFLIIAMVIIVLKDENIFYPELKEGEEWGYRDKSKDQLGIF